MKKTLAVLAIGAALTGCGGGGGDDASNSTQSSTYTKDGIYLNDTDLVVMLVDTDLADTAMLVGDYVDNSLYFNDTHTVNDNTMTTKGLAYVSSSAYAYDADLETTVTFTSTGATISGVVDNTNLVYSFERTGDSAQIADITGTHTNPDDGSTWIINSDSTFTINGICTINGTLNRVKGYYAAENVVASGCSDSNLNGSDYKARVITVEQSGTTYILGAMANDTGILWGSTPI
ncbi:hypothetical protein ACQEXU_13270 [Vibrio sp. TRT 21S02]|uniref:hypothetical protein n=1 Tax=Vibrio sp. TRT 21S02 TaxID=3418507 RepID=UPI003CF97B48